LLAKDRDASVLREMIGFAAEQLMELKVDGLTDAAHGGRHPDRLALRAAPAGRPGCRGFRAYPASDGGGSNGSRVRLFKIELLTLTDENRLALQVCHYPPGTSKWNKIEHRLFCHITQNWRGKPLISRETVVELIASTTTNTALTMPCKLDTRDYPKGIKVSNKEMMTFNIKGDKFHPECNYAIALRQPT
jgi:hypothetical protein